MSLKSLAFGPLPSAEVRASQALDLPSPSGPNVSVAPPPSGEGADATPSAATLSALGAGSGGGGGFSPVFPEQYTGGPSANGPGPTGTSVAALQGEGPEAGASAAPAAQGTDFLSDLSKTLSGLRATGVNPNEASTLPPGWAQDLDAAFKGLKSVQSTAKLLPSSKAPSTGLPSGGSSLGDLGINSAGFSLTGGEAPAFDTSGFSLSGQSPDVAGLEGFQASDLGSQASSGGAGGDLGVGAGLGALTGLYGLGRGIAGGNPVQAIQGGLGAYAGITGAAGVAPISSALVSASPEVAATIINAISGGIGGVAATGAETTAALTTALSGALAGVGAAAAPIIAGITSYLSNSEEAKARNAGYTNNPIKGALYSNAVTGVGGAQTILDALAGQGGIDKVSTADLMTVLPSLTNLLLPYYATAEGGHSPIRASDTLTGGHGSVIAGNTPAGLGGADQYTGKFTTAQSGLTDVIKALLQRGVSYEDLGKLPVSGDWAQQTLDAGGTPQDYLFGDYTGKPLSPNAGRYAAEGNSLFSLLGLSPYAQTAPAAGEGGGWSMEYPKSTPDMLTELLNQALGSSMLGPDAKTHASSLATSMYGGPLWAGLARMGAGGDPTLLNLIAQHFDPWVNARTWAPGSRKPQDAGYPGGMSASQYQDFTSGGA